LDQQLDLLLRAQLAALVGQGLRSGWWALQAKQAEDVVVS
jgi:hypothetical protein